MERVGRLKKHCKIYVAGAETLIGAAVLRELERQGYANIVGRPGEEPELTDAADVDAFFANVSPDYVFLVAGKSGGIEANQKYLDPNRMPLKTFGLSWLTAIGWRSTTPFRGALSATYDWFLKTEEERRTTRVGYRNSVSVAN